MSLPRQLLDKILLKNNFFIVKTTCVRGPTLARLATVSVLETSCKPSTKFPPEGLVELPLDLDVPERGLYFLGTQKIENFRNSHISIFS